MQARRLAILHRAPRVRRRAPPPRRRARQNTHQTHHSAAQLCFLTTTEASQNPQPLSRRASRAVCSVQSRASKPALEARALFSPAPRAPSTHTFRSAGQKQQTWLPLPPTRARLAPRSSSAAARRRPSAPSAVCSVTTAALPSAELSRALACSSRSPAACASTRELLWAQGGLGGVARGKPKRNKVAGDWGCPDPSQGWLASLRLRSHLERTQMRSDAAIASTLALCASNAIAARSLPSPTARDCFPLPILSAAPAAPRASPARPSSPRRPRTRMTTTSSSSAAASAATAPRCTPSSRFVFWMAGWVLFSSKRARLKERTSSGQ